MSPVASAHDSYGQRTLTVIVLAGCMIALVSFGVRSSYGLFTAPWSDARGLSREVFGLAIAIQNICWGIAQPFAGALADRFSPWKVFAFGGFLYGLGTLLASFATDPITLHLTAGVMAGLGMGGASYVTVLGVLGRIVPPERRSWALGIGAAAGSMGQFLVVPLGQAFIDAYGWSTAFLLLGFGLTSTVLLALFFKGIRTQTSTEPDLGLRETLKRASLHPSFVLLNFGFFVCGFQLAFITTHMPAYLTAQGFSASTAAWGIAIIGLCNVVGAYLAGVLGASYSKRWLLSSLYFLRSLAIVLFVTIPQSTLTLMMFCAAMGLLWLSTVPLTSGLVAVMFGTRSLAMLFGLVFFGHQIGSFIGAWLGGYVFARTGNYELMWWISVLLGVFSGLIHAPIAEKPAPRFVTG